MLSICVNDYTHSIVNAGGRNIFIFLYLKKIHANCDYALWIERCLISGWWFFFSVLV